MRAKGRRDSGVGVVAELSEEQRDREVELLERDEELHLELLTDVIADALGATIRVFEALLETVDEDQHQEVLGHVVVRLGGHALHEEVLLGERQLRGRQLASCSLLEGILHVGEDLVAGLGEAGCVGQQDVGHGFLSKGIHGDCRGRFLKNSVDTLS